MIRKAKAVWRGTGRTGNGHLSTDSGVLAETPYSYKTRFENEKCQGFRITRSALTLRASVPNLDEAKFRELAGNAEKSCPVSRVLSAQITLDAKLESAK
jgi:lipoyl-dependent peroxiredoxin